MAGERPTQGARRATLRDVAAHAGVSSATASRVLNGSERDVSEDVRRRVVAAARDVGYARAVPTAVGDPSESTTIVLVLGGLSGTYFGTMASAIIHEARARGLVVSVQVTDRDPRRELQLVREVRRMRPRAVVFAGMTRSDSSASDDLVAELASYEASGGRVLQLGRDELPFSAVTFDDRSGSQQLGVELAALGYRSALLLSGRMPLVGLTARRDGFAAGFSSGGGTAESMPLELTWDAAQQAIVDLPSARLEEIDVVVGVTDELALGAVAGLRARGLRVPDDVGVAGFNDIPTLRDVQPPLTTVHVPLDVAASEAMALLDAPERRVRRIDLYPVLRDSTAPRSHAGKVA